MSANKLNIFFFGDSICFGQGVSVFMGWVPRLAERIYDFGLGFGLDITTTNTSVNGNTTRMALERMPYDIQGGRPDILIVQFGMNDCNYWQTDRGLPRVSKAAFEANLHEVITRARAFGAKKVLLNTNHPSAKTRDIFPGTNITYQMSNEEYNDCIRNVAGAYNDGCVIFADIEKRFRAHMAETGTAPEDYVLDDLLHLNRAGHDLYFEIYYPYLLAAVESVIRDKERA